MTRVLMLHRVLPDRPTAFGRPSCYRLRGTALTPEEFDRVLDAAPLRTLHEVTEALRAGAPPPPGQVLTFDDGYREWIDHVAPRLEQRGAFATFLVCAAFLQDGATRAHPVDVFYWLLDHARRPWLELRLPDGAMARGTLETNEGKAALIVGDLKRRIVSGPQDEVREILRLLAQALDVEVPAELPQTLYPSKRELRALASQGHRLGGHGMSHRHLPALREEEARVEISSSLDQAIQLSGVRPVPFAYPDGAFDLETERQVEQAGATCALTCEPGSISREARLFQMPREFMTPFHPLLTRVPELHP